jgi:excisionase family DNA binding protein
MGPTLGSGVEGEQWLTIGEVAALLKVHANTVRRLIVARRLPAAQLGGHRSTVRISSLDLAAFMKTARGNLDQQ